MTLVLGIGLLLVGIWLLLLCGGALLLVVGYLSRWVRPPRQRRAPLARAGRAVWAGGEWQWIDGDRYGRLEDFDASARDALADITLDDRIRYREAHHGRSW